MDFSDTIYGGKKVIQRNVFGPIKPIIAVFHITLLLCGIWLGEVTARKIVYYGLLTGNVLSVAMYAAFVHSMSRWKNVNITFVAVLSTFSFFRIIVLVLNPVWWVWKTVTLIN